MKGQAETISFVLLFLIGVILFISAVMWSRGIFEQNLGITRVTLIESFMDELNGKIESVIKFRGEENIDYNLDSIIEIVNENTIEVRTSANVNLPQYWINVSEDPYIREKLEGNVFRIQLIYLEKDFVIKLFTRGPKLATPRNIKIERGEDSKENGKNVIRIELTFE